MFQPRVKLEFIRRYVPPAKGWSVYVDIDASEEGRTGGTRTPNQLLMEKDALPVRAALKQLGATVGGPRAKWFSTLAYPQVVGDRDIVAFHPRRRQCVIAEIEGSSSGQSEQKLYKAMGQLVMAASVDPILDWKTSSFLSFTVKQSLVIFPVQLPWRG